MNYKPIILIPIVMGFPRVALAVQEPEVTLEFVQTEHASSFPPLMRVGVRNVSYTPLNLVDRMVSSELLIDGKVSRRKELPFEGPPGLSAQGRWEACQPVDNYALPVSPGRHRIVLKLGGALSNEVTVDWPPPVNWRKGNMKSRMKEVRGMAEALKKRLPRDCVEEWLTEKDGGVQDEHRIRYFLEPQIKVVVPYSPAGEHGRQEERVVDPVQVYQEPRLRD